MSPAPRFIKVTPQTARMDPTVQPSHSAQDNPLDPDAPPSLPEDSTSIGSGLPTTAPTGSTSTSTATTGGGADASGLTVTQSAQLAQLINARNGLGGGDPGLTTILRPGKIIGMVNNNPLLTTAPQQNKVSQQDYDAEYWTSVVKNPAQRKWWAERAVAMGMATYDPNAADYVAEGEFSSTTGAIYKMWRLWGENALLNPVVNQQTPEDLLDGYYNSMGGRSAFEAMRDATIKATPNPIQTTKQISTTTLSKAEADTIADGVAMEVLGHMASEEEMKRARSAMNRLLKANPTVTTTTSDSTDPNNQVVTSHTKSGLSANEAQNAYQMKLMRSSEGMAFNVGKMMENAMTLLDRGL